MPALPPVSDLSDNKRGGNTKPPRFQLVRWIFTLFDESMTPKMLHSFLNTFSKEFVFQKEKCPYTGRIHFQGVFALKQREYFASVRNLFPKAHIEPCKDWFGSKLYCSKLDTKIEGPWNEKSTFVNTITTLRGWQMELFSILQTEPNDRDIIWIWEKTGNLGKSAFAKWLVINHNAVLLGGKKSDSAFAYDNQKIVIFDISRTSEQYINYDAIESLKNGIIFSTKYECKLKIFNSPHIVCFSNNPPDTNKLSLDRWKIYNLTNINSIGVPATQVAGSWDNESDVD